MANEVKLSAAQLATIRNTIDQTVADFVRKLPEMINRKLSEATAHLIGLREWGGNGKWEVDSFAKDNSVVGRFIHDNITKAVATHVGQVGKNFKLSPGMKTAIERAYADHFERSLRYETEKLAAANAARLAAEIAIAFKPTLGDIKIPPIDDPRSGDTAIGTVILEQAAEKIVNGGS